jgi:regulator of replication initiation timing
MKVIVRCANNRVTKAEMEREIEKLFQENKDLRVQVGHLHDELANAKASVEIQRGFREEMAEEIEALEKELAKSESESSQGMNAMVKFWEEAVNEKNKAEERAEEYRIALMESDCRVDELEKQLAWVREEVARLTNERDTAVNENTALTFDVNDLRDALNVEKELRNRAEHERELYREKAGKYLDERNTAWDANKRLAGNEQTISYYQEIADKRQEKLDEAMRTITSLNNDIHELEETVDGLNDEKRAYGEEIDRLRKVVTNLQSTRFTTDEFIRMITRELMPSTGNSFADSVDF